MESLLLLLCFLVLVQIHGSKGCLREERTALLDIKAFLNTYNLTITEHRLSSWVNDPKSDCCGWNRVQCDPSSKHVVNLYLQGLFFSPPVLQGNNPSMEVSIDFSLFKSFKELRSLNLSDGQSQRLINTEVLGNLSNLEVLILRKNSLSEPIQVGFCELKKIRVLDLSYNVFHGPLPRCFGNLTSLQALDLSRNYLSGEIPTSSIARLNSLEYLSLLFNFFEGSFPLSSFANNSKLKVLALEMAEESENDFQVDTEVKGVAWVPSFQLEVLQMPNCKLNAPQGTFPRFLSYQHDLRYLDLSNNNLVGIFPNWLIVNNSNMRSMILHHNIFTGPLELPTNVTQIPHPLYDLQISKNKMAGKLPKHIGHIFPNLIYLNVSSNGFDGSIPISVGNMSDLYALDLSRNNFSGEVSQSLWTSFASLRFLVLSDNSLSGQLFPSSLNMSQLELLFLDNNDFHGTLQHGILELPYLEGLDISNNNLWGTIADFISKFPSLREINLSRNNFTGALPRDLCTVDLFRVHLSHNKFSGTIPACYVNLKNLLSLDLHDNNLVGSIPHMRKTGSFLTTLDLRDNNLSGKIPLWIDNRLRNLIALLLGGNYLQGHLPNQLCQLKSIRFLDLSRNNFTGNLPSCFNNASFGAIIDKYSVNEFGLVLNDSWYHYPHFDFWLSFYQTSYVILTEFTGVVEFRTKDSLLSYSGDIQWFMSGIDLSCNQLSGKIPSTLGYLHDLRALNLSHNYFNGSIPKSFHKLRKIESLDLSFNNLSGQIPLQLQDLNSLAVFNVSYNNFSGMVPNKGQFGSFDESSYIGNSYLILNNSNRGTSILPTSNPTGKTDEDESVIDFTSFYWSFFASYVTVLLILATVLWINLHWRRTWFYFIETCLYKCFYRFLNGAFF